VWEVAPPPHPPHHLPRLPHPHLPLATPQLLQLRLPGALLMVRWQ
jgi:hypothetical protein